MADNVPFSADQAKIIATDDVGGVHYQIIKFIYGGLDTVAYVTSATPLPVAVPATTTASNGATTVGTSATLVRAARTTRVGLTLQNLGSVDVFWGTTNAVTTASGLKLAAGIAVEIDARYSGDVYAIVASGTADVRYFEVG